MMLSLAFLLAAAQPPAPAAQEAAPPPPDFYQRIERRIAADPAAIAALGRPAPQMRAFDWLIGNWDVSGLGTARGGPPATGTSVVAPALGGAWLEVRTTYAYGAQTIAYVGYSAIEGHWIYADINNLMSANRSIASAWVGERIVFEGDPTILGLSAHVRQTLERQGPDNFSILQEERTENGWRQLGIFYYHRRAAGL